MTVAAKLKSSLFENVTMSCTDAAQFSDTSLLRTGAGEHDVIDLPVQSANPLHHDLSVVDVLGDEARPVADGLDGVLQQGVVLDKLEGLVRQVEGAADVLPAHHVVDTLVEEGKKKA